MFFPVCGLLASNADIVVTDLISRWSEDARTILMSSEVEEHRQPFRPLVKKGHVADVAATLKLEQASHLCKVNWGPPRASGISCARQDWWF